MTILFKDSIAIKSSAFKEQMKNPTGPWVGAFEPLDLRIGYHVLHMLHNTLLSYFITVINKALWTDLGDQDIEMQR